MLDDRIRSRLSLPVVSAPMFLVSGADLVRESCLAGIMGVLPRPNSRTVEHFDDTLGEIRAGLDAAVGSRGSGPLAVSIDARSEQADLDATLRSCARHGVDIVISAGGNPAPIVERVHDVGALSFHDVTNVRFARKAAAGGVDGLVCVGSGGGGHSGAVSHLAFVPSVRTFFDGTIVAAGAISTGGAVRAVETLGADLAYLGTRFIASQESLADPRYKQMLVDSTASDLYYLTGRSGIPANWLGPSLVEAGVELEYIGIRSGDIVTGDLPLDLALWTEVWSGGQGIELIHDVPTVAELVRRLSVEYTEACELPPFARRDSGTAAAAGRTGLGAVDNTVR